MTDLTALDRAHKTSVFLVQMKHGAAASPSYERWAAADKSVSFGASGVLFLAMPALEIELPNLTSTIGQELCELKFPRGKSALVDVLASGEPHSPVQIDVYEVAWGGKLDGKTLHHHTGIVSRALSNAQGARGVTRLTVPSWKMRLDKPMGIPANPLCTWTFGQRGCQIAGGVPFDDFVVASISKTILVTTADATPPGGARATSDPDHFWQAGYIQFDGLNIDIRDWDGGVDMRSFTLMRQPPASWIGQTVTIFAGCDKNIGVCRSWDNEEHFAGFGHAIPPFNPALDQPESDA